MSLQWPTSSAAGSAPLDRLLRLERELGIPLAGKLVARDDELLEGAAALFLVLLGEHAEMLAKQPQRGQLVVNLDDDAVLGLANLGDRRGDVRRQIRAGLENDGLDDLDGSALILDGDPLAPFDGVGDTGEGDVTEFVDDPLCWPE